MPCRFSLVLGGFKDTRLDNNPFLFQEIKRKNGYRTTTAFRYPQKYPQSSWISLDLAGFGQKPESLKSKSGKVFCTLPLFKNQKVASPRGFGYIM